MFVYRQTTAGQCNRAYSSYGTRPRPIEKRTAYYFFLSHECPDLDRYDDCMQS